MLRSLFVLFTALGTASGGALAQAAVHVEPSHLEGPRILADQTATAVVKNYIESWQSLKAAAYTLTGQKGSIGVG